MILINRILKEKDCLPVRYDIVMCYVMYYLFQFGLTITWEVKVSNPEYLHRISKKYIKCFIQLPIKNVSKVNLPCGRVRTCVRALVRVCAYVRACVCVYTGTSSCSSAGVRLCFGVCMRFLLQIKV